MSTGYVPYPVIPPLPSKETHRTQPGDQWSTLSPEQSTNVAEQQALTQQRLEDIAGPERQLADQQSQIRSEASAAATRGMEQQALERQRRDEETAADLAMYKNRLEGAYKRAQSAPPASLFADGTTGEKVMRGVGLAMAGLGDAIRDAGAARMGRGPGPSTFLNLIEMDLQRQRENIAKLKDEVLMARTGVNDAAKAREVALAEVDAKGAGFMKRIEGWMQGRMDALKNTPLAKDVDQAKNLAAAKQAGLEYQQRSFAGLERKHAGQTVERIERDNPNAAKQEERTEARDEEGNVIGHVVGGKNAAMTFEEKDTTYTRAEKNLQALHDDIVKYGPRVFPGTDAAKRRDSLYANAVGAVAGTSPLGKTDEAVNLEKKAIGASGAGTLLGANADVLKAKIHEVREQRQLFRRSTLQPVPGGEKAMAEPVKGQVAPLVPAAPANQGAIPPATPDARPESDRDLAIRKLRANPGQRGARAVMEHFHITPEDLR